MEHLEKKGFSVELEKRVNGKIYDVWAENDVEIIICEVVITSDRIFEHHIKALALKKPVRFFKVYPDYPPKLSPKWQNTKTLTLKKDSYHQFCKLKAHLEEDTWESLVDFLYDNLEGLKSLTIEA